MRSAVYTADCMDTPNRTQHDGALTSMRPLVSEGRTSASRAENPLNHRRLETQGPMLKAAPHARIPSAQARSHGTGERPSRSEARHAPRAGGPIGQCSVLSCDAEMSDTRCRLCPVPPSLLSSGGSAGWTVLCSVAPDLWCVGTPFTPHFLARIPCHGFWCAGGQSGRTRPPAQPF
ncbi:hypothetical protein BD413DRAFT_7505 [Trametes elegans]|nr:hypothetical protein BD413DRAFT_7505 [Trametes elegans]